ncbi:hypothetical protein D9M70_623640 [compost metagenome]
MEVECRQFAAEVLRLIRRNDWGLRFVDNPVSLSAQPAEFRPGAKGYESWCVTWEQVVYLEEEPSVPDGGGIHPFEVCRAEVQIGGPASPVVVDEIHLPQE